jgi:CDP-diacylglycerol pyrophosphatase
MTARRFVALLVLASTAAVTAIDARSANRDALRQIVEDECLVHWLRQNDPAPCESVSLSDAQHSSDGYAVLADIKGGAHFLLIPTTTVAGIESREVLEPQAPNYFAGAWQARDRLAAFLGHSLRRDEAGFAVNPQYARGQDQLHIHIECLGPELYSVLHAAVDRLHDAWSPIELAGRRYQGLRVMGEDLGDSNPFSLLAERMPAAKQDMGAYTLLLAGMQFKDGPGFIVLTGKNLPGAENFLDSSCAVSKRNRR